MAGPDTAENGTTDLESRLMKRSTVRTRNNGGHQEVERSKKASDRRNFIKRVKTFSENEEQYFDPRFFCKKAKNKKRLLLLPM
jgi:hypothetical protein